MALIFVHSTFKSVCGLINRKASEDEIQDFTGLVDSFRFLRNFCINFDNQKVIEDSILQNSNKILSSLLKRNKEIVCLQIGLQFLGNFIVNNQTNREKVWSTCRELLSNCLKFKIPEVQTYAAMILYNIFLGRPEFLKDVNEPMEDLIQMTLSESTSEFAVFILELFVLETDYIVNFYDLLNQEHRLIILEIIKDLVVQQNNKDLNPQVIKFFSNKFIQTSDCILNTCENYAETVRPVETLKILELLVIFSSDDGQHYFDVIIKETSLLINCVKLLRSVHAISKEKGNVLSMITKISEMNKRKGNDCIQKHPMFGFKCSLIRLIGNLCWKNLRNQNKVRELEGIALLLDCCNIDARNPFIIQWCVLAIRNICENNTENQKVISSMSKKGKIDVARLKEIGITLNSDRNGKSVCMAPLK